MGVSESSSEGKTLKIKVIDFILKHPDLKPKKIAEKMDLDYNRCGGYISNIRSGLAKEGHITLEFESVQVSGTHRRLAGFNVSPEFYQPLFDRALPPTPKGAGIGHEKIQDLGNELHQSVSYIQYRKKNKGQSPNGTKPGNSRKRVIFP